MIENGLILIHCDSDHTAVLCSVRNFRVCVQFIPAVLGILCCAESVQIRCHVRVLASLGCPAEVITSDRCVVFDSDIRYISQINVRCDQSFPAVGQQIFGIINIYLLLVLSLRRRHAEAAVRLPEQTDLCKPDPG